MPLHLPPGPALYALRVASLFLATLVSTLVLIGIILQIRSDRRHRHRIRCYQDWEGRLTEFLFKGGYETGTFGPVPHADRWLFRNFLARYESTLTGQESEIIRMLYLNLGVHETLSLRLRSRDPKVRAQAALEISVFRLDEASENVPPPLSGRPWRWMPGTRLDGILDLVLPLLDDPVPFVAHTAALSLSRSRQLRFASPVLAWVMREERYQRERLLQVLEGFGPGLLPWMKDHLEAPNQNPEPWVLYALLVGSHRHQESLPRLVWLLDVPDLDLRVSILKALTILADPKVFPKVAPFANNPAWPIRAQAARALGVLGGPDSVPALLSLAGDAVYEVRRNAAQSLVDLGHIGVSALTWLAEDPKADRFARDIAKERLEWVDERGHL